MDRFSVTLLALLRTHRELMRILLRLQVVRMVGESQEPVGAGVGGGAGANNKTPTLEEYGTNLTAQAEEVCTSASFAPHSVRVRRSAIPASTGLACTHLLAGSFTAAVICAVLDAVQSAWLS